MTYVKGVLLSILVVFLTACGGGNDNSPHSKNTSSDLSGSVKTDQSNDEDEAIDDESQGSIEDSAEDAVTDNGGEDATVGSDDSSAVDDGSMSSGTDDSTDGSSDDGSTVDNGTDDNPSDDSETPVSNEDNGTDQNTSEETGGSNNDDASQGEVTDPSADHYQLAQAYFEEHVQPTLSYCKLCHGPGGVADVEGGRRFVLLANESLDFGLFYASWKALGRGIQNNPILTYNSDPATNHSGGKIWKNYLPIYDQVIAVFTCWETAQCDFEE